jgi:hypothetical protein
MRKSNAPIAASAIFRVYAARGLNAGKGIWRLQMRVIMLVQFPIEPFNTAARNGTVGAKIKQILDDLKPEAAYFTEQDGHRGAIFVVDVRNSSDIPKLAEPLFLSFNAEVKFRIAMTPEDIAHADLDALGKKWA